MEAENFIITFLNEKHEHQIHFWLLEAWNKLTLWSTKREEG